MYYNSLLYVSSHIKSFFRSKDELNVPVDEVSVQLGYLNVGIHRVIVTSLEEKVPVRLSIVLLELGITGKQLVQVIVLEVAHTLHDNLISRVVHIQLFLIFKHILKLAGVFGVSSVLLDAVDGKEGLTLGRRHLLTVSMPLSLDEGDTSDLFHLVDLPLLDLSKLLSHLGLFFIEVFLLLVVVCLGTEDLLLLVLGLIAFTSGKSVHVVVSCLIEFGH